VRQSTQTKKIETAALTYIIMLDSIVYCIGIALGSGFILKVLFLSFYLHIPFFAGLIYKKLKTLRLIIIPVKA
jgi:hypothetical protein